MIQKNELIEIYKNNFYNLFYIPKEQFDWTFSYPLIPIGTLTDVKDILKECGTKYKRFNEYFTIRGDGKMFTYCRPIVPVSVSTVYSAPHKVSGKEYPAYFSVCCNFLTIDDAAFYLRFNFETPTEYMNIINSLNEFLEQYTYMPDSLEFENYWKDFPNVTVDFN